MLVIELLRLKWRRATWLLLVASCAVCAAFVYQFVSELSRSLSGELTPQQVACQEAEAQTGRDYHCLDRGVPAPDLFRLMSEQVGLTLIVMAVVLGCTFLGYDYSSRALAGDLMNRPNRWRMLVAKLGALVLVVFPVATVLAGLAFGSSWLIHQDALADISSSQLVLQALRTGLLSSLAAAVGGGLALVIGNTLGALSVALAWPVTELAFPHWDLGPWNLLKNLENGVSAGETIEHRTCVDGVCKQISESLNLGLSLAFVAGLSAVVIVVAGVSFRRRSLQ